MKNHVTSKDLAGRIRLVMQLRKLTVAGAAECCGMPQPTLETYLYGQHLPGAQALADLATGLNCSVDWLLLGTVPA